MAGIYIPMEIPKERGAHKIRLFVREDGTATVWGLEEYIPYEPLEVIPVPNHKGPLVDALEVINAFPDEYVFTNEQARALTNYIIPVDGEGDTDNA